MVFEVTIRRRVGRPGAQPAATSSGPRGPDDDCIHCGSPSLAAYRPGGARCRPGVDGGQLPFVGGQLEVNGLGGRRGWGGRPPRAGRRTRRHLRTERGARRPGRRRKPCRRSPRGQGGRLHHERAGLHRPAGRRQRREPLLGGVFGDAGRRARSAVGVAALPLEAPVEVELVVSVAASIPVPVAGTA